MSYMWYVGAAHAIDTHPDIVRSTLDETDTDRSGPAELHHSPQWNELDTDNDPALVGLSPRQLSGDVNESKQYAPFWSGLAQQDFTAPIDEQIASSGTAAKREVAGQFGHGTAEYTLSLEPVIREGAAYGNDYFMRTPALIQEPAGAYMASPIPDVDWQGVAAQIGESRSRDAFASLYDNLWK